MKTFFVLQFFFVLFFSIVKCEAANYIVELKNGATFITPYCWEEEQQLKCYLFGGITGFDKIQIKSVRETVLDYDTPYLEPEPLEAATESDEASALDSIPAGDLRDPLPEKTGAGKKKPPFISITQKNHFLDRRDSILGEMNKTRNGILAAKKDGHKVRQREFEEEFIRLNQDFRKLFDEVVQANGGSPAEWWPSLWDREIEF